MRPSLARGNLVEVEYTDPQGYRWRSLVPEGREHEAAIGIIKGPPNLSDAFPGLPEQIRRRLHDELYNRGLFTRRDLRSRHGELGAALQAALRLDIVTLLNAYSGEGGPN